MLVDLAVLAGFVAVALAIEAILAAVGRRPSAHDVDRPPAEGRRPGPAPARLWRGAAVLELSDPRHPGGRHLSRATAARCGKRGLARPPHRRLGIGAVPKSDPLPTAILDAIDEPALIVGAGKVDGANQRRAQHCSAARSSAATCALQSAIRWRSIRSWPAGEADMELIGIGSAERPWHLSVRPLPRWRAGPADRPIGRPSGRADADRFRRQCQPRAAHPAGDDHRLRRNAGRGRSCRRSDARAGSARRSRPKHGACSGSSRT